MDRWSRFAPLTGLLFTLLGLAGFATAGKPPGAEANGQRVIAFYVAHRGTQRLADILLACAFASLIFFAGSLRTHLRRATTLGSLDSVMLVGAGVVAAGGATFFGFDFALADVPAHLSPAAAQALNVLALQMVFPLAVGLVVFGIAGGLAIVRSAALPRWLGWVAIAIGIVAITPLAVLAIVALLLWAGGVGIVLARRREPSAAHASTP